MRRSPLRGCIMMQLSQISEPPLYSLHAPGALILILLEEVLLLAGPHNSLVAIGFVFDGNHHLERIRIGAFRDYYAVWKYVTNAFGGSTQLLEAAIAVT
jgi:hypothetical protein